jgi:hypothetical protein
MRLIIEYKLEEEMLMNCKLYIPVKYIPIYVSRTNITTVIDNFVAADTMLKYAHSLNTFKGLFTLTLTNWVTNRPDADTSDRMLRFLSNEAQKSDFSIDIFHPELLRRAYRYAVDELELDLEDARTFCKIVAILRDVHKNTCNVYTQLVLNRAEYTSDPYHFNHGGDFSIQFEEELVNDQEYYERVCYDFISLAFKIGIAYNKKTD